MAKKPTRIQSIMSILNGGFNFATSISSTKVETSARVVSEAERDKLMRLSTQSDKPRLPNSYGQGGFLVHAQKMLRSVAHDKIENDRILEMAPEVSQAASIMIPSILSPNDLKNSAIQITSNCKEITTEQNKRIGEILTEHFEKLEFSTLVPQWIMEALYRSGAKPILILPLSSLQKELTQGPQVIASQEAFIQKINEYDKISVYDIADKPKQSVDYKSVIASTESFSESNLLGLLDEPSEIKDRNVSQRKTQISEAYKKVVSTVLSQESLAIIDNPSSIQFSQSRTKEAKAKITKNTKLLYKESTLISVKTPDPQEAAIDHPIFMQLPSESVIPVYTPGAPSDHIGYFVLLNEFGHPIEATPDMMDSLEESQNYTANQSTFQQLFQAYGMTDFLQHDSRSQVAMTDIYQNIVEAHLHDRLTSAGFGKVSIGKDNSVYRYMFSRYLQQRRTKLLFVPKDLMTYFCFKHNEYGIGESKLNELKFILALRISLIVCRMLVAFNNAIDRKKIEITFPPDFTGNVLEHLRTVQREAMRKSAVSFSHDPMAIAQQVVNKSITVKARGVPGLQDYDISNESNQKNDAAPDEQLSEDLKNMLILKLEVPAAAMNNLGEFEYSRSVVTTNLFFSRVIIAKQKIVINNVNDVVRKYTTFSKTLREKILEVISTKHNDGVTPAGNANIVDSNNLDKIIEALCVVLPSPNVAPDKAQFEALDGMLSSVDGVLNAILSDDLVNGNADLASTITSMRALTKSKLVKKYIHEFGFGDLNFPDVEELDQKSLIELRQTLINISKGLTQQQAVFGGTPATPSDNFGAPPDQTDQDFGGQFGDTQNPDQTDDQPTPPPTDGTTDQTDITF